MQIWLCRRRGRRRANIKSHVHVENGEKGASGGKKGSKQFGLYFGSKFLLFLLLLPSLRLHGIMQMKTHVHTCQVVVIWQTLHWSARNKRKRLRSSEECGILLINNSFRWIKSMFRRMSGLVSKRMWRGVANIYPYLMGLINWCCHREIVPPIFICPLTEPTSAKVSVWVIWFSERGIQ